MLRTFPYRLVMGRNVRPSRPARRTAACINTGLEQQDNETLNRGGASRRMTEQTAYNRIAVS
jgi:hypothetical protein